MNIKKHLSFSSLRIGMSNIFRSIPDPRHSAKVSISLHDALMSGFACMHFQDPSLLQFQKRMEEEQHQNNLKTLFEVKNIPKDTQMREIIDRIDSNYFSTIFKEFYSRLQRGKHLGAVPLERRKQLKNQGITATIEAIEEAKYSRLRVPKSINHQKKSFLMQEHITSQKSFQHFQETA